MKTSASTTATVIYANAGLIWASVRRMLAMLAVVAVLISSQTKEVVVDAFLLTTTPTWSSCTRSTTTKNAHRCSNTTALHARKYIVIGGNIDGINSNQEEDTYNMSKKERRRREREKGDANFKSGAYKTKKKQTMKEKAMGVNFDKLDDKVTKERMLFPREIRNAEKNTNNTKKLSPKAARLLKQRTSGGNIDSNIQTPMMGGNDNNGQLFPEKQAIQIRVVKRGNKVVTMVQGMTLPFKERKVLLKEMKSKLGGGGALVEGVLELQGSHAEKILEYLKSKGYSGAKIVK